MADATGTNWKRIAGNAGIAFFTTLSAAGLAGLDADTALKVALIPAIVQAGLAFFKDLAKEGNGMSKGYALLHSVTVL